MLKAHLIFNPSAGRFASLNMIKRAIRHLEKAGWEIGVFESTSGEHTTNLARNAASDEMDAVFIAGGDGSIMQVVAGLLGSSAALGVLPTGTANVFASELGLPRLTWTRWWALEEATIALADATVRAIDVGMFNQTPFLMWAGMGLDGLVVNKMESRRIGRRRLSTQKYALSILWHARTWRGMNVEIEVDGKIFQDDYILAVASNIPGYAGGFARLSPNACLDDGIMDLWLFEGNTSKQTLQHIWHLLTSGHDRAQQITNIPFQNLVINTENQIMAQLDGDPFVVDKRLEIQVKKKALNILVPKQTPIELFSG